jgi:2-oxoglutarate/2-oxoacid ferredoxin oxidoreductase subunit alpha
MNNMPEELTIRITGEAGQGMQTIGEALCRMFNAANYHIFANQDYMSRIRGGNNYFQLRISKNPVHTLRSNPDIIVCLDKASIPLHKKDLSSEGLMILDKKKLGLAETDGVFFDVPLSDLASAAGGKEIFINSVSCGVIAALVNVDLIALEQVIRKVFADKPAEIINTNISAAKAGYEFTIKNYKKSPFKITADKRKQGLVLTGNDAIVLGAIKAGCKFYCAYPMSPSTGILVGMANYSKKFDICVEQAEDEIAAINMIIGASFAGVRSMAGTSGGGFALMVEGLSLAGMTETPIVVAVCQRPGPATGFPTRTEQADLDFLLSAGHGEFARVLYTPGTIEEAFYLTVKAFNISEKYQVPVLILSDQHLSESYRDVETLDQNKIKAERFVISKQDSKKIKDYKRYAFTESGISPRAIPSWIDGFIYADSDEHTEEGHITEDALIRVKMVEKRLYKKMAALQKDTEEPAAYNIKNAKAVFLGFGSTYGVLKELSDDSKGKAGFVHLSQVWPFPKQKLTELLKGAKKIITVENNAQAQLAGLLRRETGIAADSSILKFDGRPFDLDYLKGVINKYI